MDLKDTIIKQLAAPVKRKGTQDYMTDKAFSELLHA